MESRLDNIPNYLQARSPLGLRRLMLQNNLKLGQEVHYFDIQFVNGAWYAWFYQVVDFGAEISKTPSKGE